MSAQAPEKIGIIVIHGVGETYAGWINGYLIPRLETWAAYGNVDGLARRDKNNDLVLTLPAKDRDIIVALGADEDFRRFCFATGLDPLADDPHFSTRSQRLKHRDRLVYQLGMVLSMLPADKWLSDLCAANVPSGIAFEPESTVYHVRDPASSNPTKTWQSFSRRLALPRVEATVTELFWADMSNIGDTSVARLSALIQLFMESPFVLGKAFLKGSRGGIHGIISWLINLTNWIMHWPIAGMTIAILVAELIVIASQLAGLKLNLPALVALALAMTASGGFAAFRKWVHRKIGLAYLSLAGAFYAAFFFGILGYVVIFLPAAPLDDLREYIITGMTLLLAAWTLWTITALAAALAVVAVFLFRLLTFRLNKAPRSLSRPAAALSLSMILGMLWKAVLALLSIMIINALVPDLQPLNAACPADMTLEYFALTGDASADCTLAFIKAGLIDVNAINTVSIVFVLLVAALVISWRLGLRRFNAGAAQAGTLSLPRMIASPLILAAIFATGIFNALALYIIGFGDLGAGLRAWAPHNFSEYFSSGVIGIGIFFFLLRRVAESTDGIVHIGRDLVDHQYDPSPSAFALRFEKSRDRRAGAADPRRTKYRLRQRIQRRLEALIDDVILAQQADRLIFLAHSQGTVIMHDYLMNHDDLIDPSHRGDKTLASVKRIDALTLGSPLGHLYRYYFQDYDTLPVFSPDKQPLIYKLRGWTNMWRVDDPIARHVSLFPGIENIGLPPGGHMDYWREDAVCEKIWALIHGLGMEPPEGEAAEQLPETAGQG